MKPVVPGDYRRKIKTADELRAIIGAWPREKKVVMCHGTFDIVHPGHVRHLMYARGKGDLLVTSLTCDAHIVKANYRPFIPEEMRAMNLAALEVVDYVVVDRNPTPLENITRIQPDYFVKGQEYVAGGLHPETAKEKALVESYGGEMIFTPGDIVFSSSAIIESDAPNIGADKLAHLLESEAVGFDQLYKTLDAMEGLKIHVVGDTIVDTLTHTNLIGANGKTPTFSVLYEGRSDFVGGAGIVAKHLRAAGADVVFSTVLGKDALRDFVLEDMTSAGIDVHAVVDPTRPTTNKNAFVAGGYRLLKVDTLDNRTVSERVLSELCDSVNAFRGDATVFSDFRHGIFSRPTLPKLIEAIPRDMFRVADSQVASRWGNILDFEGFDLITPNEREARFALGDQDTVIRPLGSELYRQAKCRTLMLKMGARGMMIFRDDIDTDGARSFFAVDSFAEHVVDPVGSGDALLAYATLALKAVGNPMIAGVLGSMAAAVECEQDGNQPITPEDVRRKLKTVERRANFH